MTNDMIAAILHETARWAHRTRLILTIDGPCGSGKSTLAAALSDAMHAPVVHLDDFSIPHAQKNAERLAIPGGNLDADRLLAEVLRPWLAAGHVSYRPYLCHEDVLGEAVELPQRRILILEGSYSNLPPIREHADVRVFLTIDPALQRERLKARVGAERLKAFESRWIPLEQAYFAAYGLPDADCMVFPQGVQAE